MSREFVLITRLVTVFCENDIVLLPPLGFCSDACHSVGKKSKISIHKNLLEKRHNPGLHTHAILNRIFSTCGCQSKVYETSMINGLKSTPKPPSSTVEGCEHDSSLLTLLYSEHDTHLFQIHFFFT